MNVGMEKKERQVFLAWIARLLRIRPDYKTLEIRHEGLKFTRENKEALISFSQLFGAQEMRGRLLDRIDIELAHGKIERILGIPKWKTATLVGQILGARTPILRITGFQHLPLERMGLRPDESRPRPRGRSRRR